VGHEKRYHAADGRDDDNEGYIFLFHFTTCVLILKVFSGW
jgi:hypothetical protein